MAGMNTVLTTFSNEKDKRTSTFTGHATTDPHLVIETRKVPSGNQTMAEYKAKVVQATVDANSEVLQNKVSFEVVVRYPVDGNATDISEALGTFRDIIAGDEFAASVTTQKWL